MSPKPNRNRKQNHITDPEILNPQPTPARKSSHGPLTKNVHASNHRNKIPELGRTLFLQSGRRKSKTHMRSSVRCRVWCTNDRVRFRHRSESGRSQDRIKAARNLRGQHTYSEPTDLAKFPIIRPLTICVEGGRLRVREHARWTHARKPLVQRADGGVQQASVNKIRASKNGGRLKTNKAKTLQRS